MLKNKERKKETKLNVVYYNTEGGDINFSPLVPAKTLLPNGCPSLHPFCQMVAELRGIGRAVANNYHKINIITISKISAF